MNEEILKHSGVNLNEIAHRVKEKQTDEKGNFRRLVPIIIQKGIENMDLSMFDDETKKKLFNAVGDEYVRLAEFPAAVKVYVMAENRKKLFEIAQRYELCCLYKEAITTYGLIGDEESSEKIRALGEKCLGEMHLSDAVNAFLAINNTEKLEMVAERCVKSNKIDLALEIFKALKNTEKLNELGDQCLTSGRLDYAAKAYEYSNDTERLNRLGDHCMKRGLLSTALKVFQLANNQAMVTFIKTNFAGKV